LVGAAVLVGTLLFLAVVAFFIAFKAYRIPSAAMEPTLHCARPNAGCGGAHEDRILVLKHVDFGREDIVAFHVPPRAAQTCGGVGVFVKRVIGLPGEMWQERRGFVYINGKKLKEPYVKPGRRDFQSHEAQRIGTDRYVVLGDNRDSSCDSRVWGTVPRANIIGKVFAVYWPPGRIHFM
jgi:signal peptidase I